MKRKMPYPEEILAASERTGIDPEAIAGRRPYEVCLICAWRKGQTMSEFAEAARLRRGAACTARAVLRKQFPGILPTLSQVPDTGRAKEKRKSVLARLAALNEQIAKGSSVREAVKILGINGREWEALKCYTARHGLELPKRERIGPQSSKFLELLLEGRSTAEAAELIGMPLPAAESTASRWRKLGVIREDQGKGQTKQILARWAKEEGLPMRQLKQKILRDAAQAWKAKKEGAP